MKSRKDCAKTKNQKTKQNKKQQKNPIYISYKKEEKGSLIAVWPWILSGAPGDRDAWPLPHPGTRPSSPGWSSAWVRVEGVCSAQTLFLCPEMEAGKKVKGCLVRASLCLPTSLRWRRGGPGSCNWWGWAGSLAVTQSGSSSLLGAGWAGEELFFPSHHPVHLLLPSAPPCRCPLTLTASAPLQLLVPASPTPVPRSRECPAPSPSSWWGNCVSPQSLTPTLSF